MLFSFGNRVAEAICPKIYTKMGAFSPISSKKSLRSCAAAKNFARPLIIASITASLGTGGCSRQDAATPSPGAAPQKQVAGKIEAPALLALKVKRALDKPQTLREKVAVGISGKTIRLTGTVPGQAQKRAASVIAAKQAPGYKIENVLTVQASPRPAKGAPPHKPKH